MTPTPVSGAALPNAAAPETLYRRRRSADLDDWFHFLYPIYAARFHPAVAAIEAELGARRRIRRVLRR